MPITTEHPDYARFKPLWKLTRDVSAGNSEVKKGGVAYLPATFAYISATDSAETVADKRARFMQYQERAYLMGVVGRTKAALLGMIFRKPAEKEMPPQLEGLLEDIDGNGQSIEQVSKEIVDNLLDSGRHFILVDYPAAPEGLDSETESQMNLRPTFASYPAEALVNWRVDGVNGKQRLTLVVLKEEVEDRADEFAHDTRTVYRVLRLRDGVYTQEVVDAKGENSVAEYTPRMAGGKTFDHIPGHIIGALNNKTNCDYPPLYDLAILNLAHYRNVADIEEAAYLTCQPMFHLDIGETSVAEWADANPDGMALGSRRGIVTQGGKAELLQVSSDNMILELKREKEKEMVMIGARLVQAGGQAETAEASRINASAEASTLDTVVSNASEGIEAALEDMARFIGVNPELVEYKLNANFWETKLAPQDFMAAVQGYERSIYAASDVRHMIRSGSLGLRENRTDEDIDAEVAGALLQNPLNFDNG